MQNQLHHEQNPYSSEFPIPSNLSSTIQNNNPDDDLNAQLLKSAANLINNFKFTEAKELLQKLDSNFTDADQVKVNVQIADKKQQNDDSEQSEQAEQEDEPLIPFSNRIKMRQYSNNLNLICNFFMVDREFRSQIASEIQKDPGFSSEIDSGLLQFLQNQYTYKLQTLLNKIQKPKCVQYANIDKILSDFKRYEVERAIRGAEELLSFYTDNEIDKSAIDALKIIILTCKILLKCEYLNYIDNERGEQIEVDKQFLEMREELINLFNICKWGEMVSFLNFAVPELNLPIQEEEIEVKTCEKSEKCHCKWIKYAVFGGGIAVLAAAVVAWRAVK